MHLSSEVAASDVENFRRGNNASEVPFCVAVKRELSMEVDDKDSPTQTRPPRSYSATDSPGDRCEDLTARGQTEIQPSSSDFQASSGQKLHSDRWRATSSASFAKDSWNLGGKQEEGVGGFGNAARLSAKTGSDRTARGCFPSSAFEVSRSCRREAPNVDGGLDRNFSGSETNRRDDVVRSGGETNGMNVVGHRARKRHHRHSDELVLSTPFGLFHRAPPGFCWGAGGQSTSGTSASYSGSVLGANASQSLAERGVMEFLQTADAERRSETETETETPEKVNKKLSYRPATARCVVSVEILPAATQQCRNYLYDKS